MNEKTDYVEACNYPGVLDAKKVATALTDYGAALGIKRDVVRLRNGWTLTGNPALMRSIRSTVADFSERSRRGRIDPNTIQDSPSLRRFAAWCLNRYWYWWDSDVSYLATTHLGAVQIGKIEVDKWAKPVFDAYIHGCWILIWTDTTLYWVAKPSVFMELAAGRKRLHRADGPALESDLEDLYFWHGVLVPDHVVMAPEKITIKEITEETNAELRRVLVERYGEERYIADSSMKPVHKDDFGELYVQTFTSGRPIARVRVRNSTPEPDGTHKFYWLPVNPALYGGDAGRVAHAAVASTWRTERGGKTLAFSDWRDYRPQVET